MNHVRCLKRKANLSRGKVNIQEKNENYSRRFNNRLTDLTLKKISQENEIENRDSKQQNSLSQKASTNCVIRFLRIKSKQTNAIIINKLRKV